MIINASRAFAVLIAGLLAAAAFGQTPTPGTLTVEISGVHPGEGVVRVALWRAGSPFMKGHSDRHAAVAATADSVKVEFEALEKGEYAVSAYQDANNNGRLDSGFMGRPIEPYGFSNDARGMFGPPAFRDASFVMSGENRAIRFRLK